MIWLYGIQNNPGYRIPDTLILNYIYPVHLHQSLIYTHPILIHALIYILGQLTHQGSIDRGQLTYQPTLWDVGGKPGHMDILWSQGKSANPSKIRVGPTTMELWAIDLYQLCNP